jgi:Domain of unknown function (DUF4132)
VAKNSSKATASAEPSAGQLLDVVIEEHIAKYAAEFTPPKLEDLPSGGQVLSLDPLKLAALVIAALDRIEPLEEQIAAYCKGKTGIIVSDPAWERLDQPHRALVEVIRGLLSRPLPLDEETIVRLLSWPARAAGNKWIQIGEYSYPLKGIAETVEGSGASEKIGAKLNSAIEALIEVLQNAGSHDGCNHAAAQLKVVSIVHACRRTSDVARLDALLDDLRESFRLRLAFKPNQLDELLKLAVTTGSLPRRIAILPSLLGAVERVTGSGSLSAEHRQILARIRQQLAEADKPQKKAADKLISRIDALGDDSILPRLKSDGGWADMLRAWVETQEPGARGQWNALLHDTAEVRPEPPVTDWRESTIAGSSLSEAVFAADDHLRLARGPAAAWRERMAGHVNRVGHENLVRVLRQVLAAVPGSKASTMVQHSINREMLRGLLWLCVDLADAELVHAIFATAKLFYRNNSPLGEASGVVLFQIGTSASAAALTTLSQTVRSEGQRTFLETAREMLAEKLGVDPTELGDDGVPSFGFTEFGALKREFGTTRVELRVGEGRAVGIAWSRSDGTPLKSVPAAVKREHGDEVESLKATAAGVREALGGLAGRLESSWLTGRTWRFESWREQLIDHFVAGTLGRRLSWIFDDGKRQVAGLWQDGGLIDLRGRKVRPQAEMTVSLWHPMSASVDEIRAWRDRLEAAAVTQPFKQTYREVYILTAAERATRSYSNRFAAHILRQAQFRQLAKSRGWSVGLVGPWDGGESRHAVRKLPRWKLRAEFWLTGAGDEFQTGYTYISTDQVRFYQASEAEPMPLTDVPPLVLSEIMRDVDLFVGVASVGNDPNWADGGPAGQYSDYWQSYSFGEPGATAQTRKALLEKVIPRLKIANRCTLADRFLIVKGDIHTYKIHLGSGNILMEPNDQYLCIVPKQTVATGDKVFLPFEGDSTLSAILSKAFLLADDTKIKDPTIVSQLKR